MDTTHIITELCRRQVVGLRTPLKVALDCEPATTSRRLLDFTEELLCVFTEELLCMFASISLIRASVGVIYTPTKPSPV